MEKIQLDKKVNFNPEGASRPSTNILFICSEYPPIPHGGLGIFVKNLAESLTKEDFQVFVVGIHPDGDNVSQEKNGVTILNLKEEKLLKKKNPISNILNSLHTKWKFTKRINSFIDENGIQLVESYEWTGPLFKKLKSKLIVRLHGSNTAYSIFEEEKVSKYYAYWEKKNYLFSDTVVSVSDHMMSMTIDAFGKPKAPSQTIYNSYNSKRFGLIESITRKSEKILFVGKYIRRKGVFELAEIINEVLSKNSSSTFHFVGNHTDKDANEFLSKLDASIHSRVQFTKAIDQELLPRIYNESSVMLMPSRAEAFGLTAIEAMACGCIVVMNSVPVASEIINSEVDGIVINCRNTKKTASRILDVFESPETMGKMRKQAIEGVYSRFSDDVIVQENKKLYLSLLK